MKVKQSKLTKEQFIEALDVLYTSAGTVRGRSSMKQFLKNLLTPSERIMLGRRLVIARRLLRGDGYVSIQAELNVGRSTVFKVKRWLEDQMPGYENALSEMEKEFAKRKKKSEKLEPFSWRWLKKKYPLHFLLFPD